MEALTHRQAVIEWAGAQRAFPVQNLAQPDQVDLAQPGEDRSGWKRVGWEAFFTPLEASRRILVIETADQFAHRILPEAAARAELPRAAFGPPFWTRLMSELWPRRPVKK
jgi:hypothetical protein